MLKKRSFLCASDYDEGYFDFHCTPRESPPAAGSSWYTICGTPFPNQAEYVSVIAGVVVTAAVVYYNMLFRSSATLVYRAATDAGRKKKRN